MLYKRHFIIVSCQNTNEKISFGIFQILSGEAEN